MSDSSTVTVDFVAKGDAPDEWKMVLVEEGPWTGSIETELRRLQDRLYGALEAAVNGQLADKFPDSKGKNIIIQLDAYNVPRNEVGEFFDRFSNGVLATPDYKRVLTNNPFVRSVVFCAEFESIN